MDVFKEEAGRMHKTFHKLKPNLIRTLDEVELKEWMYQHSAKYYSTQVHV